jgi:hypothetical protein
MLDRLRIYVPRNGSRLTNRVLYIVGLLGIISLCSVLTIVMVLTEHVDLAVDALKWGVTGAFLWGFLKESHDTE